MSSLKASEDAAIERASTLGPPLNLEEPVVEIDRKMTSTNAIRDLPKHNVGDPTMATPEGGRGRSSLPTSRNLYYQSVSTTGQARIHNGNIYNNFDTNRSLFDPLVFRGDQFSGRQTALVKESKASYRIARLSATEPVGKSTTYVSVRGRNIKAELCRIARLFQYIDNGFAEYFQTVVSRLPRDAVEGHLESARSKVVEMQGSGTTVTTPPPDARQPLRKKRPSGKKQPSGQPRDQSETAVYLGDLGNYCEEVFDKLRANEKGRILFNTTDCAQDELLHYLQDSFETPYWQFMLSLFLQQNVNSRSLSATVVFRVLSSLKIEVLHRVDLIRRELSTSEDIEPLMRGIDARVKVLEQAWHSDTSELEASELYQTLFQTLEPDRPSTSTEEEPTTSAKTASAFPENQQSNAKDTIIFIGLIAFFFVASLIPGYLAFSISINTPGIGSTSDADFWNLLQSSVIAVLGSLMSVIPLIHGSYFSTEYTVTWVLWGAGCVCAIISAVIYPFCNTAYSSAISYFGSVFSLMAVLATAQVVPKPVVLVNDKTK